MSKNFIQFVRNFTLVILSFVTATTSLAANFGDTTGKYKVNNALFKNYGNKQHAVLSSLADLDKILGKKNLFQKNEIAGFTSKFFDDFNNNTTPQIDNYRDTARVVIDELEKLGSFIEFLAPSDLGKKLPIGFTKRIGNQKVTIAISSIIFTPKFAELTIFARITVPQAPGKIFFGIKGLKLSYNGGIIGDAKLTLLGDLAIPINGRNSALKLKGGFDINTGQGIDKTYITIDCNGFKNLRIDADVEFPRSLLLPVDAVTGDVIASDTVRVKGSFNTFVSNWNDILASFSLTPFQVKGLKDINFTVTTAAFDFSDFRNSTDVIYPAGYEQKYLNSTNPELWRGVYVKNLTVSLPRGFKDKTTSNRVSFGVNDMIVDNNGFTGVFFADNVLPIRNGNAGGWKFSVDSIRIALEANNLMRAGFGGKIGIPIAKDDNTSDTLNKKKYLSYRASIAYNGDYVLNVATLDSLSFDIFKAKAVILPNSYVQLKYQNNVFLPEAMLHGSMGMYITGTTASTDDANPNSPAIAEFKGIVFQGLNIKTVSPYISATYLGYQGELKLANFPLSVESIAFRSISSTEAGIDLNVKITLQDGEFTGSTGLTLVGSMVENQGIRSWKYNRLTINSVAIHADIKGSFELDGYVNFMNNDPVYGNGWMGGISAKFKKGFNATVAVNAIFGRTNFRYWYIDGKASIGEGVGLILKVNGFGGGAYYRMKKDGFGPPTFGSTGVKYTPDSTAGLGVKAAVLFNIINSKVGNGEASFEIAFNKGGGIRYLGFFGFAKVMADLPIVGNSLDYIGGKFKDVEDKLANSNIPKEVMEQRKIFQPSAAAKDIFPPIEQPGQTQLSAFLGIQYNFNESSLHATFDLYVNAGGGIIQGAASGNRAGWAVLHIDPDVWYLRAGTPTDKLGIKFNIGPVSVVTGAYFMLGQNMPAFPPPPPVVVSILNQAGLNYVPYVNSTFVSNGTGVAFGASVSVTTGELRFLMLYASFGAGLGFDMMLTKFADNVICAETGQPVGLKGWYAQGQAYAYLYGELGIRVKLLFIRKDIKIISGSAAALVEAKLPNTSWFRASVAVNVTILGFIKINLGFKFTVGNYCTFATNGSAPVDDNPFDQDYKAIGEITPAVNASNTSLFVRPKINFNLKLGETIQVDDPSGGPSDYYKPMLDYCKIVDANGIEQVTSKVNTIDSASRITLKLKESLTANTTYKVVTKVSFMERKFGSWVPFRANGVLVEEIREVPFTTGVGADTISLENCEKMYPFVNQKYFYKNEVTNGVCILGTGVSYIFNEAPQWKARFFNSQTGAQVDSTLATYVTSENKLTYTIGANLQPATNYRVEIVKSTFVSGSADSIKPALTFKFTTSQFGTFAAKIQSLQTTQTIVSRLSSEVIALENKLNIYEGFEEAELTGNNYTNYKPLVSAASNLLDSYYLYKIKPLIYNTIPLSDGLGIKNFPITYRDVNELGIPPAKAINISSYYLNSLTNYNANFSKIRLPFIYNLPDLYNQDYENLKTQIANFYLQQNAVYNCGPWYQCGYWRWRFWYGWTFYPQWCRSCNWTVPPGAGIPSTFAPLFETPFPFMDQGNYKVNFQFKNVDGSLGTMAELNYNNPIE